MTDPDRLRDRIATALYVTHHCGPDLSVSDKALLDAVMPVVREAVADELDAAADECERDEWGYDAPDGLRDRADRWRADQMTPDELRDHPWRVGTHYGIHVYEARDDDKDDRPVATFHDPADAAEAVAAVNADRAARWRADQ